MSILQRYVLFELLKTFAVALTALTAMMMIVFIVKEATSEGLGLEQVARLTPYILPNALRFTVPGTILFAVCSVYGRMSGSNEVIAIKSLGISPGVILWPAVIISFVLSLTSVWLNDLAVSWGRQGIRSVIVGAVEQIVYNRLTMQKAFSSKNFSINVSGVDGRRLLNPTFSFIGDHTVTVRCKEAELRSDKLRGALTIVCRNGTVDIDGEASLEFPNSSIERELDLEKISPTDKDPNSPSSMAMHDIFANTVKSEEDLRSFDVQMAAKAAHQMISGDFENLTSAEWNVLDRVREQKLEHVARLRTEPHRRWANGFSCLCFVFVGAPLAIMLRNSNFLTSFFACFLPILIAYYPLLLMAVDRSKDGAWWPASVWLGNLVLMGVGEYLRHRVFRY